jgi:hypothetical protein
MKVRATALGHIYNVRKREGDVFELVPVKGFVKRGDILEKKEITITPEMQFSAKWMEKVGSKQAVVDDDSDSAPVVKRRKKQDVEPEPQYSDDDVI